MPHQCTECGRTFADGSKQMLAGCPDCGGNKFQFRPKGSVEVPEEPAGPRPNSGGSSGTADPDKTRTTTLREWARKVTPGSSTAETSTPSASSTAGSTSPGSAPGATSPRQSASASSSSASGATEGSTATSLDSFGEDDDGSPSSRDSTGPDAPADGPDVPDAPDAPADAPTADPANPLADSADDAEAVEGADHEDVAQADARSGFVGKDELPDRSATDADGRPLDTPVDDRPRDDEPRTDEPRADRPPEAHESRPDLTQLREELNDQFESIKVVEPGQYELNLMELYDREEYIIALQENGRYVIEVPDAWDATE